MKRVHNLPPYLSYVSTLPDIIHKPKRDIDELKKRLIDTWDRISQGPSGHHRRSHWPVANTAVWCVQAKEHYFKHLVTQLALF